MLHVASFKFPELKEVSFVYSVSDRYKVIAEGPGLSGSLGSPGREAGKVLVWLNRNSPSW